MKNSGSFLEKQVARSLILVLLAIVSVPVWAGNFTLQQVLSSPFPSQLVAASHAARIAWVFDSKGARNVWVAEGPNFAGRQLTHYTEDDGQPIASLRLTPDGRTVLYARGTETNEHGRVADPTNGISARKQLVWATD